jgi:hypothetical protein
MIYEKAKTQMQIFIMKSNQKNEAKMARSKIPTV